MGSDMRSKRIKCLDAPVDLISDLPRHVLDGIMEYLPLRDAARMSVLSHKWRDIWISTPQLAFDAQFFSVFHYTEQNATHKFCNIVSKLLFQHDGPILKFSLYVPPFKDCPDHPDVNHWLSFLSRNGIRDFSLQNYHNTFLTLSSHLFTCLGLEKLILRRCILSPTFCSLGKLVRLELLNVAFRKGTFEYLIAGSPLLEQLSLTNCFGVDHVAVAVAVPNLRYLILSGNLLHVKNAENLFSASIALEKPTKRNRHKDSLRDLIEIFANSTKLEKLSFGGHFCQVLLAECRIPTTFKNIRNVHLSSIHLDDVDDFLRVASALEMCPNIEKLDVSVNPSTNLDEQLDSIPGITLYHLSCAKVGISSASNLELKLIELLLACSPVLEILSLSFITHIKECLQLRMLKQLIRFRRASSKVEVTGLEALNPIISADASKSSIDFNSSSEFSGDSSSEATTDTDSFSSFDLD